MRIDSEQLSAHLKRGLASLYTVFGEEALLALEAADRVREAARPQGYEEREVLTVEASFDWSRLAMSGNSLSLFSSRRLLELRIPSGKPGNDGAEAIRRFAANLPPDTVTLVSLPKLDRTALQSAWFSALESAGTSVAANPVPLARLPQWIAGRLAEQGQQADPATLQFLADMVEGNLLAARQEVGKLALLFPPGPVQLDDIKSAVLDVARYDVFKLGEPLLGGDAARFVRVLHGLKAEGAAAPLVLWAISEELHALWRVDRAVSAGRPLPVALREARVWGPRADLLPRRLRRVSTADLEAAIVHAAEVDRMIKGLANGDVWDELTRLGLRLLKGSERAKPAA
jgi:DNA polymerase-3 subunit delta